jgi:thiaminase
VEKGRAMIEEMVEEAGFRASKGKVKELAQVFRRAAELEVGFWEEEAHVVKGSVGGEQHG